MAVLEQRLERLALEEQRAREEARRRWEEEQRARDEEQRAREEARRRWEEEQREEAKARRRWEEARQRREWEETVSARRLLCSPVGERISKTQVVRIATNLGLVGTIRRVSAQGCEVFVEGTNARVDAFLRKCQGIFTVDSEERGQRRFTLDKFKVRLTTKKFWNEDSSGRDKHISESDSEAR
jgi:acylphosphatase